MAHPRSGGQEYALGKSPSQLKTVEDLTKKVEALQRHRGPLMRQWKLNLAFYKGKQYSYYPPRTDRLESLAVDEGLKPRHRVRIVSNQIMPGTHTLLAQLTKTKPKIYATPGSGAENELRAAQMAQSLVEHLWSDLALDEKLDEAILWSIIASAGYWKITWDPYAAKQMRFLLAPDGNVITDEALKTEYLSYAKKMGVEPKEQIVYMGDIRVDVLSPFNVILDPGVPTFEDATYAVCIHDLDPDEINTRYGVRLKPDVAPASPDATIPFPNSSDGGPELTLRRVYIGYFKPTAALPNGRYVVWTEGGDKKILVDEKWPYPMNDLPIVKFAGMRIPGSVYDDACVTHAVPLQKELNRTISQIVEYKNLTINPTMTAPVGSMRTRRTTEPGQILEYQIMGDGRHKPEFVELPTLPPYVFEHLNDIRMRLQEIFLVPDVVQGKVPPNVEAGVAIDLLQEMAVDRLSPIIRLLEHSLARAGQQMLSLAQKYYIEARHLKIRGSGGSVQVKQFKQADIAGELAIHVETGSGLPRTRAGRQARIERMIELQMIHPREAYKYLDVADLKGLQARYQVDEDLAYRNLDKILEGMPINPEAIQSALTVVQQGINPDTMEPIQSPEEAEQIIRNAGLTPNVAIDHDIHISVTGDFIKGVEFEKLQPESRQDLITYFGNLLNQKLTVKPSPEPQAARVTYQIKGTAGPSVSAKILERAGVGVTPDETSEPPLETWVTDSVDKPDMDATGPGQEAEHLSQAAKIDLSAKLADAEAKHAAALQTLDHQTSGVEKGAGQARDQEIHDQKVRQEAAKASFEERKARETSFKKPEAKPKKKAA